MGSALTRSTYLGPEDDVLALIRETVDADAVAFELRLEMMPA